ncbi:MULTISPECIES: hypothetical protein [Aerosakkonema]|uniref:hypothetical protein n=1 Tax=Aerosakkonema TaxID=1246629 RepID=UPI0035B6B9E0
MGAASRYWKFITIDATGRRKVEEIASAKVFFKQQFPEQIGQPDVGDTILQSQLWRLLLEDSTRGMADICLRCFISHQIEQVCVQLETQFGREHGFTRSDLFPFVLDDDSVLKDREKGGDRESNYKSLATEILQSFDPERSSLATWTTRLVKHHQELNKFLLERGVYLISNWAILNDTKPKQLQRIFSEFCRFTPVEIERACILLDSYHAVYRRDRLKSRQSFKADLTAKLPESLPLRSRCLPPTETQLQQIAQLFRAKTSQILSGDSVMKELQDMAEYLREYRIYVRGGKPSEESLDVPENRDFVVRIRSDNSGDILEDGEEEAEFLKLYRDSFEKSLDEAVKRAIASRVSLLQRQNSQVSQQFLLALNLFHCQAKSMTEIASLVGLQAQYQVTRLLKLKEFRADVRQQMLKLLRNWVLDRATAYADPEQLQTLSERVDTALDEQITAIIQQAEAEACTAKKTLGKSLFTEKLCQHLEELKI